FLYNSILLKYLMVPEIPFQDSIRRNKTSDLIKKLEIETWKDKRLEEFELDEIEQLKYFEYEEQRDLDSKTKNKYMQELLTPNYNFLKTNDQTQINLADKLRSTYLTPKINNLQYKLLELYSLLGKENQIEDVISDLEQNYRS